MQNRRDHSALGHHSNIVPNVVERPSSIGRPKGCGVSYATSRHASRSMRKSQLTLRLGGCITIPQVWEVSRASRPMRRTDVCHVSRCRSLDLVLPAGACRTWLDGLPLPGKSTANHPGGAESYHHQQSDLHLGICGCRGGGCE